MFVADGLAPPRWFWAWRLCRWVSRCAFTPPGFVVSSAERLARIVRFI
jgi:hypothetical protein